MSREYNHAVTSQERSDFYCLTLDLKVHFSSRLNEDIHDPNIPLLAGNVEWEESILCTWEMNAQMNVCALLIYDQILLHNRPE